MATPLRKLFGLVPILFFVTSTFAQTHTPKYVSIGKYSKGYYEYLPEGYDPAGTKIYPLILFIHGGGDIGDGSPQQLPRLLKVGLTRQINIGEFPSAFTVNGQTFKFIIISPQFVFMPSGSDAVSDIETMLNYVVKNYKVDISRIYMTGLSKGGGLTFDFAGSKITNANKLAAIVPSAQASTPVYDQARTITRSNLPVWATHNLYDQDISVSFTNTYIEWINEAPAPTPAAKKTIFPGGGHDSWTQTYNPQFKENNMNVYEWMLQYRRAPVATPPPTANLPMTNPSAANLLVYPNPVKDNLHIQLSLSYKGLVEINVYNMGGMLVKEWKLDKQTAILKETLSTSELPAAAYLVEVKADSVKLIKQFLKN